jgi:hypothetical protein
MAARGDKTAAVAGSMVWWVAALEAVLNNAAVGHLMMNWMEAVAAEAKSSAWMKAVAAEAKSIIGLPIQITNPRNINKCFVK